MRNIARVNKPISIPEPRATLTKPFMKYDITKSFLEFIETLGIENIFGSRLIIRSNCPKAEVKFNSYGYLGDFVHIKGSEFSWFTVRCINGCYDFHKSFMLECNDKGELVFKELPYVVNGMFKLFDSDELKED